MMFNYAHRYQNYLGVCLFFDSFHAFINILLLSLLTGLIWEVFIIVDKDLQDDEDDNIDPHAANKQGK